LSNYLPIFDSNVPVNEMFHEMFHNFAKITKYKSLLIKQHWHIYFVRGLRGVQFQCGFIF